MLHLLLIILVVVVIWKIAASPTRHNPHTAAALRTGLRRMQIVLAVLAALFGGLIGYGMSGSNPAAVPGGVLLGAAVGFALVWGSMAVLLWILAGFIGKNN